jgi:hypothetical protein
MYTGNFRFPSPSITGSAPEDIVTLPYVLGVKITITDKFSSHPSPEEMSRLASEAYVAGLQSGKPGLLHIHVAEYGDPYAYLRKVQEISGVPSDRFVPTHCNTNRDLLDGAVAYALAGTRSISARFWNLPGVASRRSRRRRRLQKSSGKESLLS